MAVKFRLTRHGSKKKPYYRIVVADERYPRDGKFIDMVGSYDSLKEPVRGDPGQGEDSGLVRERRETDEDGRGAFSSGKGSRSESNTLTFRRWSCAERTDRVHR